MGVLAEGVRGVIVHKKFLEQTDALGAQLAQEAKEAEAQKGLDATVKRQEAPEGATSKAQETGGAPEEPTAQANSSPAEILGKNPIEQKQPRKPTEYQEARKAATAAKATARQHPQFLLYSLSSSFLCLATSDPPRGGACSSR